MLNGKGTYRPTGGLAKAYAYGKTVVKNVQDNYGYYKAGRQAEVDEENAKNTAKNKMWMQNIKQGTPEKNLQPNKATIDNYHATRGKGY